MNFLFTSSGTCFGHLCPSNKHLYFRALFRLLNKNYHVILTLPLAAFMALSKNWMILNMDLIVSSYMTIFNPLPYL